MKVISDKKEEIRMNRKTEALLATCALVLLVILSILTFPTKMVIAQIGDMHNPTRYNLLGATSHISGTLTDVQFDDVAYMSFGSYFSGKDISEFVDNNTSDVDGSADIGTHSNFSAQQYGPDSIYDTLKEQNTTATVDDWGITSNSFTDTSVHLEYRYLGGTSPDIDNMTVTKLHIRYSGTGTMAIALYTGGTLIDPTEAIKRTEAYNVAVFAGWNEIDVSDYDWEKNAITWVGWCHSGGNIYYSSSSGESGDFQSARGRWSQTIPFDANETSSMPTSPGSGSFVSYWYAIYVEYEAPNYEMDLEVQWTSADYDETNEELAIRIDKGNNTYSLDALGGFMIIGDGTPDWGSTTGTISFWIKLDTVAGRPWGQHENMETRFSGSNLVLDWGAAGSLTSSTSFTAGKWYFIAIVWDENTDDLHLYIGDKNSPPTQDAYNNLWASTVSTVGVTQNNFMASKAGVDPIDGHGDDLRYWNTDTSLTEILSNYNAELTGLETNLRSYFKLNSDLDDIGPDNNDGLILGSYSFSSDVPCDSPPTENVQVDVWNGGSWQTLFTDLAIGWNNVSISPLLNSATFTIRLKGEVETNDTKQDSWRIDVALLHVWSKEHTAEVEFTGLSNEENWSQLTWMVVSSWTTSSVNVTLQLYNYTLGDYSSNGNGCLSYISSILPGESETAYQTITLNPNHFRNATSYWKMKIKGVKATDSEFTLRVDLVKCESLTPREVAVLFVTISPKDPYNGEIVRINVTVRNEGGKTETFNVTAYYNDTQISKKLVSNLVSGIDTTLEFSWNTTKAFPATYIIKAIADAIPGEANTTNNTYIYGLVKVAIQTPSWPFEWTIGICCILAIGVLLPFAIKLRRKRKAHKLTESTLTFHEQFGVNQQQLVGRKTLLEVDPTLGYHNALFGLVSKAISNGEQIVIFTRKNSALQTAFSDKEVELFLLTPKISSSKRISKKEVLIPVNDLSVLLDTLAKVPKKKKGKPLTILFDNLSDTILMCRFEKTYKFLRFLLEAISSPKVTALFIFNPTAHDPAISSSIRGLFQFRLTDLRTKQMSRL